MPWAERLNWPAGTLAAAPKITDVDWPAAMEKELAGEVVTPEGMPESVTCTEPEKPLIGVMPMLMGELELPWAKLTELGERLMLKSGCGGGD